MLERDEIDERLRYDIGWQLWKIGFFKNSPWCECLIEAIALVVENQKIRHRIMKQLYPAVGKAVGTTSENAERRIRRAIEATFTNREDNEAIFQELFGNSLSRKKKVPTNEELIVALAERIGDEPRVVKLAGKHLRILGIPMNTEGYDYFKQAIEIALDNPEMKSQELYCQIGKEFGTTAQTIKVAMHRARKRVNPDIMKDYFEDSDNPSTMEFIQAIVRVIKS